MSDYDRGPYTPSERPLSFDTRYPRELPPKRRGPAPVALVISIGVLSVMVAGGGFLLYRNGVRGPNDGPRPVGAPVSDVRTIAPPQAQTADAGAGLAVYRDNGAAAPAAPSFAPPPESPAAIKAPPPTAAVAAADLPPAAPPPGPVLAAANPPPSAPRAMVARITPLTAPRPHPTAAAAAAATLSAHGAPVVQIGAFSSPALADKGWQAAAAAAPGQMTGKGKHVEGVEKDGATLYRATITGFASRDEAQKLCASLKSAGRSCFVR